MGIIPKTSPQAKRHKISLISLLSLLSLVPLLSLLSLLWLLSTFYDNNFYGWITFYGQIRGGVKKAVKKRSGWPQITLVIITHQGHIRKVSANDCSLTDWCDWLTTSRTSCDAKNGAICERFFHKILLFSSWQLLSIMVLKNVTKVWDDKKVDCCFRQIRRMMKMLAMLISAECQPEH